MTAIELLFYAGYEAIISPGSEEDCAIASLVQNQFPAKFDDIGGELWRGRLDTKSLPGWHGAVFSFIVKRRKTNHGIMAVKRGDFTKAEIEMIVARWADYRKLAKEKNAGAKKGGKP
jgi:hypothetical protein